MNLTVTLIQTDLAWEDKVANLTMLQQKMEQIGNTEVIILPEMFTTGFSMKAHQLAETMEGNTVMWMKEMANRHHVIITGSFIAKDSDTGNFYNRLVWMQPDGKYGYYDKRHLFAYADEQVFYTAGSRRLIASVKGWKINLQICYDLRFPVWARQGNTNQPEYDVLVYIANWPERRSFAWKTLLQARAIENQCYVIGVNRVGKDGNNISHSGESMVVDPLGAILYCKPEEDVFTITLEKQHLDGIRKKYPFLNDRDAFNIMDT